LTRKFKFSYLFSCFLIVYKICGKYPSLCYDPTIRTSTFSPKPSSSFPSGLLAVIILLPMFCLILCVYTGIRSQQRSPSSVVTVNHRRVRNPHRQYPIQGPGRIIRARPVHSVSPAPPIPSLYEVPPPSYEAVTSDLPPKYESAPVTAMVNP
jgi:hypothetical protein